MFVLSLDLILKWFYDDEREVFVFLSRNARNLIAKAIMVNERTLPLG